MSTGYGTNDYADPAPFGPEEISLDELSFAPPTAIQTAREIEEESGNDEPPSGEHRFRVLGVESAKRVDRDVYVGGQLKSYHTFGGMLNLARADKPSQKIRAYVELPPNAPDEFDAYYHGKKMVEAKGAGGFLAKQFFHLVEALGFPVAKGQPLPAEACAVRNWVGRELYATVQPGRDDQVRINPRTGAPYPVRNEIKAFSYRSLAEGPATAAVPHPTGRPQAPQPNGRQAVARSGLASI